MRAAVALSLLLAGCEFTIPSGAFTCGGAATRCPPGQACVDGVCVIDGPRDAGSADAGMDASDGGGLDAGATDGGARDGGPTDGGPTDGGPTDGGPMDAATTDAGSDASTVACPTLVPPLHGAIDRVDGRPGDVATYSCVMGYVLTGNGGSAERACGATGAWSGEAPTCEAARSPCDPNPCLNGGTCSESSMSFNCACVRGYLPPTCAARVSCPGLTAPTNGGVDRTSGSFGDVATYSCGMGYTLSGPMTRMCLSDGSWSGAEPTCDVSGCITPLVPPTNGAVDVTTGPTGTVATFMCGSGFALSGAPTRTCMGADVWSGRSPTCLPSWNGAWLVGASSGGGGMTAQWTTDRWGRDTSGADGPWRAVWGASPSEVWIVGPYLRLWDGTRSFNVSNPTSETLHAVGGTATSDVWVVGDVGVSARWDGAAWTPVTTGSTSSLRGLWASSSTDVWAVGSGGTSLRWSGGAWSPVATGVAAGLEGVWGSAPDAVWAVGQAGTILRWNGAAWSGLPAITASDLLAVWGAAADDVWAVGTVGSILHWNGAAWTSSPSGTTATLRGVWGAAADDVWAVGDARTLLHWDGVSWETIAGWCPPACVFGDFHAVWGP